MRVAAISVLVTLALLGTSCATEGSDAESATAADRAAEEPTDTDADAEAGTGTEPAAGTVVEVEAADAEPAAEVELVGFSFAPAVIDISVGDTVRWTNRDATRHTVTAGVDAEPTGAFHTAFGDRGDSAALQFTEPGEYRYFCTPHPFMQGTINVSG